jgi:two-component system response regulator FixJ
MPARLAQFPTVVLVDDDVALRSALVFKLELDGFAVEALQSGEALLAHPLPSAPACIVLDQNMRGLTGLETLVRLRARGVALPALLITAHLTLALRLDAAALAVTIVEKPLLDDVLSDAIRAALAAAPLP